MTTGCTDLYDEKQISFLSSLILFTCIFQYVGGQINNSDVFTEEILHKTKMVKYPIPMCTRNKRHMGVVSHLQSTQKQTDRCSVLYIYAQIIVNT